MYFTSLLLASAVLPSTWALPTFSSFNKRATTPASNHCGDEDYVILPGTPWIVYNMLYNADVTVGTQCTNYQSVETAADGTQEVVWNSVTDIEYVVSTDNVPKGYSFVGLTQGLETRLEDIASIPATYDWTRTNTTTFKGNVCFDFMTSDTSGDSTSTAAEEHMLWLQYEGGQLPIGWGTPTATIDSLFGTSWRLYTGVNTDTGITVRSMLPDTQFEGTFSGDLKDWLIALAGTGAFSNSTYVNVGNAGTEMFYGDSILNATLGLQINVGSDTTAATTSAATKVASTTSKPSASTVPTTTTKTTTPVIPSTTSPTTTTTTVLPTTTTPIISSTTTPVEIATSPLVSPVSITTSVSVITVTSSAAVPTTSSDEDDDTCS